MGYTHDQKCHRGDRWIRDPVRRVRDPRALEPRGGAGAAPIQPRLAHGSALLDIHARCDQGSVSAYAPFLTFYAIFVHASVNWDFGPLRYVVATPVFHRWHHS